MDDTPRLSKHAAKRWAERCEGINLDTEWYLSRKAGKGTRRKIREACPSHKHVMAGRTYRGFWYMVGPSGVVFVVADKANMIVTVLRLPRPS